MLKIDPQSGQWRQAGWADQKQKAFTVLATGDICPTQKWKLDESFSRGIDQARKVYGDMLGELARKDFSVANLELPLSTAGEPIVKDGPALRGPPAAIDGVLAGGFDAVTLANNHTLDFGPQALADTIQLAKERGLTVFGVGQNLQDAGRLVVTERGGKRIGLLGIAENEFSNATLDTPGAVQLRPGPNCMAIRNAREKCDLLLVFVHGGNEGCPVASPRMVRDYRALAEAGADAVIGHHAHTVQGMEVHQGVPILYGLGNFLFWAPAAPDEPLWWVGMFARLHFDGRRCVGVDIHPMKLDPATATASLALGQDKVGFLQRLNRLSEIQADPQLHQRFWNAYSLARLPHFLGRVKETRDGMDNPKLRKIAAAHLKNLFSCEAHWEVITTGLELIRQDREHERFGVEEELSQLCRSAGF
ncbi:MAG: CapA family protein [Phycisphaeraceae bacterium]|nr:CapA family protein [Phycisphaeraceae bacterium]